MVKNTPAFVLKINPKGESSSVVHVFSRDFGKLILLAKGARTAKSPFKGLLEPFSLLNLHFNEKPGRPYQFLSRAEYIRSFRDLKQSTEAVLYGSVLLELIYKVQENSRDLEVFCAAEQGPYRPGRALSRGVRTRVFHRAVPDRRRPAPEHRTLLSLRHGLPSGIFSSLPGASVLWCLQYGTCTPLGTSGTCSVYT
ncbi:MAG: DNA repair protein RecO [Candidatus Marinimicrobia bacterium]|nr:DNA repair protein RecO [Candidatus Neomarinimicrobiota bacterium]